MDMSHPFPAQVKYVSNAKSLDAFLPPWDVAGKRDAFLRQDGFAKLDTPDAARHAADLHDDCLPLGLCVAHTSPLVARHPRTQRPALHLDVKQQLGVDGLPWDEAQGLLRSLVGDAAHPSKVYRHRWQTGDVVITDNYAALHTAAPGTTFNDKPRLISRVCLPGGVVPAGT